MADHLTPRGRSKVMAAIKATNTKPELAVRQALRAVGATGYRLHLRTLPGKPDIAFTRWRVAIFIDGAFWHGHPDHFNPSTAAPYWRDKIARTRERDQAADQAFQDAGWCVVRCWDFEVKANLTTAVERITTALTAAGWRGNPSQLPRRCVTRGI